MLQSPAGQKDLGKRMQGIPALYDVEERLRVVDSFPDYTQVICLGMPALDRLTGPDRSPEWARIGNDGLAELATKYPDHERAGRRSQRGGTRVDERRQRDSAAH